MHTYRKTQKAIGDLPALWTVGFDVSTPDQNDFTPKKDFDTEEKAAIYASFLNGGAVPWWFKWDNRTGTVRES